MKVMNGQITNYSDVDYPSLTNISTLKAKDISKYISLYQCRLSSDKDIDKIMIHITQCKKCIG